jgi:hypothetical protein
LRTGDKSPFQQRKTVHVWTPSAPLNLVFSVEQPSPGVRS